MARTYEISFKLGAQMAGNFAKTMTSAGGALGQLNEKIGELNKHQSSINSLVRLREKVAESSREYIQASQKVAKLGREIAATENPTRDMVRNFERAKREVSQVRNRLEAQREELRRLNKTMGTTGDSTAALIKRQEQLAKSAEKARNAQSGLQKTLAAKEQNLQTRDNARMQVVDSAALAVAFAIPIKQAVMFESVMADVNKVANLQAEELAALERKINRTAISSGVAREQIAAMYGAAAQAGFARKEWDAYVDTATKMAVAFDMAGEESGQMLRNWRAGLNLTMGEATALASTVNHLSNNMNANAAAIGKIIQRQGAVAKQAGLTTQEVAGLSAALLTSGASPEVAATALKNLTGALTRGEAATSRQKKAFKALGLDVVEISKLMQKDATGAINKVFAALKKAPKFKQSALISNLFGEESKGAIAPLIGNIENFRKAMTMAMDETNSLQKEYATRSKTSEQNLKRMAEAAKVLAGTLGSALLPAMNSLLHVLTPIVAAIGKFMRDNPKLTQGIMIVVAALVSFKIASAAGLYLFTFLRGAWLAGATVLKTLRVAQLLYTGALTASNTTSKAAIVMSKVLAAAQWAINLAVSAGKWAWAMAQMVAYKGAQLALSVATKAMTAAQWLFNAALMANPIGLVIAAIAALVAAGVWLYTNWNKVVGFFSSAWDKIKQLFLTFSPLSYIIKGFKIMWNWLVGLWNKVVGFFRGAWDKIKQIFLLLTPLGWVMLPFGKMEGWLSGLWDRVVLFFKKAWATIKQVFLLLTPLGWVTGSFGKMEGWLGGVIDSVVNFFKTGWAKVKQIFLLLNPLTWIKKGFNIMMNWLNSFSLYQSGKELLMTFARGIYSAVTAPIKAVKNVLSKVREYLPFSDAKTGPLSQLTASGSAIMQTLSKGMGKVSPAKIMAPFVNTARQMVDGFQGGGVSGAINRLTKTGASSGGEGSGMTVQVTQNITIDGAGGSNVQELVRNGASEGADEMVQKLRAIMKRERRLSYA